MLHYWLPSEIICPITCVGAIPCGCPTTTLSTAVLEVFLPQRKQMNAQRTKVKLCVPCAFLRVLCGKRSFSYFNGIEPKGVFFCYDSCDII